MMTSREISPTSLLLDLENPRLPELPTSQVVALEAMLRLDAEKVVTLAGDISVSGLDPSARIVVMPEKPGGRRFIVLEGNRRLTALRLLASPQSADGFVSAGQLRRLTTSAAAFAKNPIEKVSCAVVESRDEADHWIRNRHTGQRGGAGLVPWSSVEVARYDQRRHNKPSAALSILDLVREHGELDSKTLDALADFPLTNLDRLIDDKNVRKALGFEKVQEVIQTAYPDSELLKPFTRMVSDIANGRVKVGNIETAKERAAYLAKFSKRELPDPSKTGKSVHVLGESGAVGGTAKKKRAVKAANPPTAERNRVFARTFVPVIGEQRINNIYHELKSLDLEKFTNACSVLFRVFVELSVDAYYRREKLGTVQQQENASLRDKISTVANHLEAAGVLTKSELQPVRRAQQDAHLLAASARTMNHYVHNRHFSPGPTDLRTAGDNMERFLTVLWP